MFASMGRLGRRLSIGSSKSRTQSLNPETTAAVAVDLEDAALSQGHDNITDVGGAETVQQELAVPSDVATVSIPSPSQKRRPSFLAKLRRRSSSVAPPPTTEEKPTVGSTVDEIVADDIIAAAAAAEMAAREGAPGGGGGGDENNGQRGRLSRRPSFSVMAQARAMLGRRSRSRASNRENDSNTNTTEGAAFVDATPPKIMLMEGSPQDTLNEEIAKTNSPFVPPGITLTRDPTEDAHDEDAACFSHLPLEKDLLDMQPDRKEEESCVVSLTAAPSLEKPIETPQVKQEDEAPMEQDPNSKDEMAVSETSDQPTVGALSSLVSAEVATRHKEGIQEEGTREKAEEEVGNATGLDKSRRRLKVGSHKKDSRSAGGNTKNDSNRKDKGGKTLKKGTDIRDGAEEKKGEESFGGPGEATKPVVSKWHRRLSISRERRQSTQSRLKEEKKGGQKKNEDTVDYESVCTQEAGKQGYLGRIRRRISLSRERRSGLDGSKGGTTHDIIGNEEGQIYAGVGRKDEDEAEKMTDFVVGAEGEELPPKKESGWSRLRRTSITSAVSVVVRGRSRDARGGEGTQEQEKEDNLERRIEQEDNKSDVVDGGGKQSLAKTLRRRLSRSSLRLPRSHSRESSLASREQEGDESLLCGNPDEGSECGAEKRTWRRRLSDRFRSKSREIPLPSPKGLMPCVGRSSAGGSEDQKLFSEDGRNREYMSGPTHELSSSAAEKERLARDAMEGGTTLQEPVPASEEEERDYSQSGRRTGGEKHASAKGNLSEELSEPFAVTPETSQTPSEQPSSEDMTPRYPSNGYLRGQKLAKRGGDKTTGRQQQRDRSDDRFAEDRRGRRGTHENETKNLGASSSRTNGAEDFVQWMDQNQEEDEGTYMAMEDEREMSDNDLQHQSEEEDSCSVRRKVSTDQKRKKIAIFFCCGNDDNNDTTAAEKDKWKQALQTRLAGEGGEKFEEQYGNGKNSGLRSPVHLPPQPLCCKDLLEEDADIYGVYPLCYAPTDCLLELGMAI